MKYKVTVDYSLGLKKMIENCKFTYVNDYIIEKNFKLPEDVSGVVEKEMWIEPFLGGETAEQASERLTKAGHTLGNIFELASFFKDYSEVVKKFLFVWAISENSRWAHSDGHVCVPCARVGGSYRSFGLDDFRDPLGPRFGALVACEVSQTLRPSDTSEKVEDNIYCDCPKCPICKKLIREI